MGYRRAGSESRFVSKETDGAALLNFEGARRDAREAEKWFYLAAEQGNAEAQFF